MDNGDSVMGQWWQHARQKMKVNATANWLPGGDKQAAINHASLTLATEVEVALSLAQSND